MMQDLVVALVFIGYAIGVLMTFGLVLTWVERKQGAIMSDRIGANRAYLRIPFTQIKLVWWGLFHGLADGLKMLLKEDWKPNAYDRLAYAIAPWVVFAPVLLVFAVIPFGGTLRPATLFQDVPALAAWFADRTYPLQIAPLDAGLLIVFAFGGLTIIGAMLAGWSSSNKFSLLGALRAGSQMISYELIMGLTVLGLIVIYGTVDLDAIVRQQSGTILGFLPAWGIFLQPFAAILFLTAAIAENKRIPFDLPEAESELIAGYFTEYSAMKMGLFMFAEFIEIAIIAALFTTLFLGGYNLPFMTDAGFVLPGGREIRAEPRRRSGDPGRRVPRQGVPDVQLPDPGALDAAAVPLRPAAPLRLEVHVPAGARQPDGDGGRRLGAARDERMTRKPFVRKRYWNEPTMSWWERAYLFEIIRGLCVTGGVFMKNMWRWMTLRKGALTTYYPEERRRGLRAAQPRQARADPAARRAAAMHRLQHVRNRMPGEGDRDRGGLRPERPRAPEVPRPLRDRLLALHLLRALRRGLPGGRDPHGAGHPEPASRRPAAHVAVDGRAAALAIRNATSRSPTRRTGAGEGPSEPA